MLLYAWQKGNLFVSASLETHEQCIFQYSITIAEEQGFFSSIHFYGITSPLRTKVSHDCIGILK